MKKILYFSAEWCGPCKQLGPIMESLAGEVNYEKINVDADNELSIKYGVRNIPTLILLNGDEVAGKIIGLQPREQILNFYKNG